MTFSMARKFAFQNLKANRLLEVPFVLSAGIMLILFNIMASLINNNYVQTRHDSLPTVIAMGAIVVGIFTFIFVTYTTNFLLKKRNKEFALYAILGLEKKHIRKIISIEFFVLFSMIAVVGVVGGYIFGQLTFLGLNRLMHDVSGRLMDFPFSIIAMLLSLAIVAVLYMITVLRSSYRIYLSTPVQLLSKQHSGEGEPKSRWLISVIGLITLSAGYYIALTTKGSLSSLLNFFIAAILVMIATYLLYISFSIIVLKRQKKKKSYFKPTKFLGISGLIYRMKSNAVSLASISIMSVGIIITLSVTATIYSNIQSTAQNVLPRDYQINSKVAVDENNYKEVAKSLKEEVNKTVKDDKKIKDEYISYNMTTAILKKGNSFVEFTPYKNIEPRYIFVNNLDGYNAQTHNNIKLNDDEVLICANHKQLLGMKNLKIGDRTFKVKEIPNIAPSNYAAEVYVIIVKDFSTMKYMSSSLKTANMKTQKRENSIINCNVNWNVSGISEKSYRCELSKIKKEKEYSILSKSEYLDKIYEMNGGFLFLGIIIGLVFLTGTILIIYYKQISEGYEDREKYQIMKKIGLSDELIKKTSSSQIVWMFFAPLIVAVIHSTIASKIVYQLLGLFGVNSFIQYGKFFGIVIAVFFMVYFIIFKFTSRTYYKIVR